MPNNRKQFSHVCRQYEPGRQNGPGLSDDAASSFFPNRLLRETRLVWIENRRLGLPSNSSKRHCLPAVAMHPQIVEAPGMWQTGDTARRSGSEGQYGRNRSSRWLLSGQVFGRGVFGRGRCNAIPPEYWIAGRRSAVVGRCPSALVPRFCCAHPILRGSNRAWGGGA